MTRKFKFKLYWILTLLFVSGLLYAIPGYLDRWFFIELDWPFSGHWLMTLHGLGAMVCCFALGYLTRCHVMVHLRSRRHFATGMSMFSIMLVMLGSGYLLYYLGDEDWRRISADIHCALGVLLPLALGIHRAQSAWESRRQLRLERACLAPTHKKAVT